MLTPKRTDTNIRYYDLESFQKLLNVSYLNNNGYKISKIATIDEDKIPDLVREIAAESNSESHAINAFKLAMLNLQCIDWCERFCLQKERKEKEIDDRSV